MTEHGATVEPWTPAQLPPSRASWRGVPAILLLSFALSVAFYVALTTWIAIRRYDATPEWLSALTVLSSFWLALVVMRTVGLLELARRGSPAASGALRLAAVCWLVVDVGLELMPSLVRILALPISTLLTLERWGEFAIDLIVTLCFIRALAVPQRARMRPFMVLALATSLPPFLAEALQHVLEQVGLPLAGELASVARAAVHLIAIAMLATAMVEPPAPEVAGTARRLHRVVRPARVMLVALAVYAVTLGLVIAQPARDLVTLATLGELAILFGLLIWLGIAILDVTRGALPELSAWRLGIAGGLVLWCASAMFTVVTDGLNGVTTIYWMPAVLLAGAFMLAAELTAYASRCGAAAVRNAGRGAMFAIAALIAAVIVHHLWQPEPVMATRAGASVMLFDAGAMFIACWLTGRLCRLAAPMIEHPDGVPPARVVTPG